MKNTEFDLCVAGHFAIDMIKLPSIKKPVLTLGGPPTYASVAARKLGANVTVISKIGEDFPQEFLKQLEKQGVDLSFVHVVEKAKTTSFVLEYLNEDRILKIKALTPKILNKDLPVSLRVKVMHVSPIANEVSPEVFKKLRSLCQILSLDPQGYVRKILKNGTLELKKWKDVEILQQTDIFKSNRKEIQKIVKTKDLRSAMRTLADYGIKIVIVTLGFKGTSLLFENSFYHIPPYPPRKFVDPTGAGDVFAGAFLAEYISGKTPVWCACVGNAAASFVVEKVGPKGFGSKKGIYKRATQLYEIVMKE